jgi:hypothetical protein
MDALMMLPAAKGIGKVLGYKGVPKELPGSPNTVDNVQKAGFLNPLALLDRITPRLPAITKVLGMEDDVVNHSPFNLIPGYGKKLAQPGFTHPINSGNTEITAYRKFGNSLDDLINSKSFRPQGGFRMGAKQIKTEGNWAEAGIANENYKGVFAAGMDPRIEGTNIQLQRWSKRNGVVGMTKQGNPAIPITDPGLEFHRRLPFSNRYVPIDKQKLLNNKFQWSTTGAGLQNVGEKFVKALPTYGLIGGAGAAALYNPYDYMPAESAEFIKENNIPLEDITDLPTRTDAFKEGFKSSLISPTQFLAEPDPHGVRFYGSLLGYSQGGNVINEEWEDELDDYTIELLRKAGYVVKEID